MLPRPHIFEELRPELHLPTSKPVPRASLMHQPEVTAALPLPTWAWAGSTSFSFLLGHLGRGAKAAETSSQIQAIAYIWVQWLPFWELTMFRGLKNSSARNINGSACSWPTYQPEDNLFGCHEATCMKGPSKLHPELSPTSSSSRPALPEWAESVSHSPSTWSVPRALPGDSQTSISLSPDPVGLAL